MATYTRKQLEAKQELELQSIGRAEFQLDLDPDVTPKAMMVDAILDAQAVMPVSTPTASPEKPKAKKFRIIIHNQEGVDNTPFVPVSINGYVYTIPRETEVAVPEDVVSVLEQAEQTLPELDATGRMVGVKTVKRFPFSVRGEAA